VVAYSVRLPLFAPSLSKFRKSLFEEGVKDDAERNNNAAESDSQDVANIVSGNARAGFRRRNDRSMLVAFAITLSL
jgi:hypothetical protein